MSTLFTKLIFHLFQLLANTEINRQKWDECIDAAPNGNIYALSWYLDAVCKNWEGIIEDDYRAVFPLTANKKYGIGYLYQPHFAQQLGIFSRDKNYPVENFLNSIPEKFRFIEICLNTGNSHQLLKSPWCETRSNSNYELDLQTDYQKIYFNYSVNTKRNIKKALKNEVEISSGKNNLNALITIFKNNKGKEFSHLKNDYYKTLKILFEICSKKNAVEMLCAYDKEKKLCAGAVFIMYKQRAVFLFSATGETAQNNGAMFLLIDTFVKAHSEKLSLLDFEGSNDADLARFYKSFGATETIYLQLKRNKLPKYLQWLKK